MYQKICLILLNNVFSTEKVIVFSGMYLETKTKQLHLIIPFLLVVGITRTTL